MQSVEESVVLALDGTDKELYDYLPYILQDLWEIGASPEAMVGLLKKHTTNQHNLKILDLGCGKGVASIKIAKVLGTNCVGFDAMPAFIEEARIQAAQHGVEANCHFEITDIRTKITELKQFDVIILGAIGPIFGTLYETLITLSPVLAPQGCFLIDDAYIEDDSDFEHPVYVKRTEILEQIQRADMILADEWKIHEKEIRESDEYIFGNILKRCHELIKKHPDKRVIFENYIKKQEEENAILETKVKCTTMLVKKTDR